MSKPAAVFTPISEILRAYWKSDRWTLLLVAVVVFLSSVASVAAPFLFSRLIDRLPQDGAVSSLAWGFVIYAVLLGVASALQHMVQYLSFMSAENLGFITGTRFFARLLRKTAVFFVEHNPAEIQNAASRGRSSLTTLVQLGLIVFIPGATQILLTLVTLGALINIEVAGIVVLYGIAAVTLTLISARSARVFLDKAIEAGQENARFVGNAMNAMETLRHFGSHDWMTRRFTAKAGEVRDNWRAYVLQRVGYIALLGVGLTLQFAVTFWLLLPRYEAGALTVGDIVLFNTLLLQLNMPFEMIAHAIDDVVRSRAALAPLATMWAAPEERQVSHAPTFVPRDGRIVFEGVGYAYDNGRGVKDIRFTAERGAITFLVGETGSGKSTIFKLALKSIEPEAGRILVDGVDLATIDRADWYSAVAVVPQDVVLLNESLSDNILLGRPRDGARLRRAAEKAAILPFIEALPEGFETKVGERGLKLSGGERQRVAIARALYGDPAILFLDEASSALDEATERDIMEHIRLLARDVTVIAITHRRSVIVNTDAVIDLNKQRMQAG
ncbi:MAG: ABC transporter ATP-binding protein [Mesorhizobium sp.]|uniref:ABC transporter ATP-binding protein n=1 Tax=Mesorhizobium sp. TaxID=1871066 RepID=UPI000FE69EED|nr:ABC transporter ATP-binding protein [Mesorhizobium sp.]RWH82199.1 MAG: ABC transporter ATP-binding protein [Mesorhizobium sp.]RWH85200.1 MAG: ABC transporter ATP-binding protein [Mesorhizobium sp.]RWH89955.1 MAG: ABC transporter ATP-binding protein [Mesorhizobium sp.]RWH98295.1 MAG: ABC transporter ATP-binding protein [Mesorhizobium sp.]RWI04697.1 MAG: ABC transporter ATP-binding protein [Mesorhizobium sp.]